MKGWGRGEQATKEVRKAERRKGGVRRNITGTRKGGGRKERSKEGERREGSILLEGREGDVMLERVQ